MWARFFFTDIGNLFFFLILETWSTSSWLDDHGIRNLDFSIFGRQISHQGQALKCLIILVGWGTDGLYNSQVEFHSNPEFLHQSIFRRFWFVCINVSYFQPSAKILTPWLFLQTSLWHHWVNWPCKWSQIEPFVTILSLILFFVSFSDETWQRNVQ